MKYRYFFFFSIILTAVGFTAPPIFAQNGQIAGSIVDENDEPLAGVNVLISELTAVGSVSNVDGNYIIDNLEPGTYTVVASFVGFTTQEYPGIQVNAGETTELDIVLVQSALELSGLVVTALGVEREERSLSYGTQTITPEEIAQARELNVGFSLAGRIAGLSVNQAGTGLGGQTRMILRGNRSISGSSQPLFVVDGVPIRGDISNINQSDISNITVLKGANAAALYGSAAQNGAVIITTNQGTAGTISARFSTNYTVQEPLILTKFQNEYGQGSAGQYIANSEFSWGPRMEGQSMAHWSPDESENAPDYSFSPQPDNVADVFRSGYQSTSNLSLNVGSREIQGYFSYAYTDAKGIVPGNSLIRHSAQVRVTAKPSSQLTIDGKLNYIRSDLRNRLDTGESFSNPIRHAFRLPRNISTVEAENYHYEDPVTGNLRQRYWVPGSNGGANPYWTLNRNLRTGSDDRIILLSSINYEFIDGLSLMVRGSYDGNAGSGTRTLWADSYIIADNGRYSLSKSNSYIFNGDALLTYQTLLPELDLDIEVSAGGNTQKRRNTSLTADTGTSLIVRNFFTLSNTLRSNASQGVGSPIDINSVYGFAKIGWRDALYLDITARNDWSSTLPEDNWSYFYPSVGLSAVFSELLPLPDAISFGRIRASYAQVGNSTSPFQLFRTAGIAGGGLNGFVDLSGTIPNENLLPEETASIELGLDMRFLQSRFGFDLTYYNTQTQNQLFSVALPIGSGAGNFFTNGGDVRNEGFEVMLNVVPVRTDDVNVNVDLNFSANTNMVESISVESPRVQIASDFLRAYFIEEGEEFGNVYSRGFMRDDQNRVIVGDNGVPMVTPGRDIPVANYNPDWLGSIVLTGSYKNWDASLLIDHRQGGTITSITNAIMYADGVTEETLQGRDGGLIFGDNFWGDIDAVNEDGSPNTTPVDAETFWRAVGGRNAPVGEAFVVDATNTRLREFTLGYTFPASVFGNAPISGIRLSLVGRNLLYIYRKSENIDPDVLIGTGKAAEGFDSFAPPSSRSFGFNLSIDY
ncbi:MAG: SusC/RagA family TonB-linked outer membrane protein [Bacteroidetes bacterium]|nr:SusC/RagA family TonB-linked outer membrane protein [Bacteroidota bacterium]MCY4232903.1 SusC/RagA family TonB-linked outer membrane protein [Bacteroidota bacterium]